ncbi:arabinosyltransferase domain-containing protein [Pseudonocardia sp. MH-G8]|uniref:arabinosyltransferase domain-containing protein n=1 Tax=Pseudonocardia sp. MH-G8 TaxID=1854588 RepID=UPI0013041703|nr:arabinosyltransferase domain-containing protein [Pseudonocardia sp. MH-G8]
MLSPARTDPPSGPGSSQGPHRGGSDGAATPASPARGPRTAAGLLGLLTVLAAVAFPLAPVQQPVVAYSWTATDGPTAIPLLPYQPVELTARTTCATVRDAPAGQVLLSTVPLRADPAAEPLQGLRLTAEDGRLRVASTGVDLGAVEVPAGGCELSVVSGTARTSVLVDGTPVLVREGDVRPNVAGAFSEAAAGVDVALQADTRFATTISPLKTAIGVVGVLALLGALLALRAADRAVTPAVRLLPRRWWRPRPVDAAVTAGLALWWAVGAVTVDDGFIAGIVRSAGSNGFIGNAYRWLNAPEAPFSWFYALYQAWSLVSTSAPWMRVPSTVLGLLTWWLLSRLVVPRLGRFATRPSTPWLAALAFATWWVPFGLGLRPEPWVAVGALAVFVAVERAVATSRVLPLAVGLVLAGATTAVTPGGLLAFTPFVAAALPLLRLLRRRRDLHVLPLVAALVAAPAAAMFLMVPDQSLAGMLEAVRVRAVIGGGEPWYAEFERYAHLLEPESFQGAIGRRAAVLVTLLAAAGVLWALPRARAGIAAGPARRLVVGLLLSVATLTLSPTKWTQHFGDLGGYGAAVLVLGAVAWSAAPLRGAPRTLAAGWAGATAVAAVVVAGYNTWPTVGAWFDPTFSTVVPQLAGVPAPTIVLVLGGAVVAGLLGRWAWHRASGPGHGGADTAAPRRLPAPATIVAVLLVGVLVLQVGGLVRVAVAHRDSYTLAADTAATIAGERCGLQARLSAETDPAAGLLPIATGDPTRHVLPVDVGGRTLPGLAVAGRTTTPWFVLDAEQRSQALPVVVTTSGSTRPGDALLLEFGDGDRVLEQRRLDAVSDVPRDVRELAPPGADTVRLTIDAPVSGGRPGAVVSLPRVPRLTPMSQVLPAGSTAILDWPVAFLFPCLTPAPLPPGSAPLPAWRVGPPAEDTAAGITYRPRTGGPFAAPRQLITERRMATYLTGDPLRDAAQLYRWIPIGPLAVARPTTTDRTVAGWHRDGHARVPEVEGVG